MTLHETAIHEAGHAVVARALGVPVTHIELGPDEATSTVARCHTRTRAKLLPTAEAAMDYAGFAAERRVNPECSFWGGDLEDFNARLQGASEATRKEVIVWTESAITGRWAHVEQLAAAIERCNGLYTEELEKLGYWWPAPVCV
jgi:hypothetical protein